MDHSWLHWTPTPLCLPAQACLHPVSSQMVQTPQTQPAPNNSIGFSNTSHSITTTVVFTIYTIILMGNSQRVFFDCLLYFPCSPILHQKHFLHHSLISILMATCPDPSQPCLPGPWLLPPPGSPDAQPEPLIDRSLEGSASELPQPQINPSDLALTAQSRSPPCHHPIILVNS